MVVEKVNECRRRKTGREGWERGIKGAGVAHSKQKSGCATGLVADNLVHRRYIRRIKQRTRTCD